MTLNVELVRTSGIFSIDGEDFEVENNIWIVGDDRNVVVIDAAHDPEPIKAATENRIVRAVICTHGHNDHINAAVPFAEYVDAPILLHPADRMLWDVVYPDAKPDRDLAHNDEIKIAGSKLKVIHTPGHSPGGVCLLDEDGRVFGGDTLFKGGPGATGRSHSDFNQIITSIKNRLLTLPASTVVHTGHGDNTTIGDEAPHLEEWIARGH